MTKILVTLCFLSSLCTYSSNDGMEKIQLLYQQAALEEKACLQLIDLLEKHRQSDPVVLGYKASAALFMAKHHNNPITKLEKFNQGREMLNEAIDLEPENIELRVLRFLAQNEAPFFLGYNEDIESDKKVIFKNFQKASPELKRYIFSLLKRSDGLSLEEISILEKHTVKQLQ